MEVQKNIAKFQEKFVVPVPANIAKIVDERDRKILADSYLKLYSGFSWINWTNGHSLGRAWQTALTQCESFINTKKNNNPALKHLRNVFKSHKKYWSRVIMTHRDSGNKISGNADWVAQMRAYGMQLIREAMDKINLILARYNERIEELQIERQNAQEHSAAGAHLSVTARQTATATNLGPEKNSMQMATPQNAENINAQPMNANTPVTEQPAIAQQATQSQPQQAAAQQQAIAQSTVAQQHAKAQQSVAQQNTPAQAQKQSQQFALTEPVKASERAISANLHKQALAQATEKLKQLQPAIAKQKESALHNIAAQQVAKPQVQVAKPKPQLSGLVQNHSQPKPRVASIAKLQSHPNTVAKVPHRPNINMILFKNFNQRVA
ncbi:MAG: hypothetical protein ACLRFN_04365 [Alphaproteobacteria bacterium]